MWADQNVDMVRHDDPGVQIIQAELLLAKTHGVGYDPGKAFVLQPFRPGGSPCEFSVHGYKCFPSRRPYKEGPVRGYRSMQTPRDENICALGVPVRKAALVVFRHTLFNRAGQEACPT